MKRMMIGLMLAGYMVVLGGCAESEEQYKARIEKEDEKECLSRGFEQDTQALSICKEMLLKEREKREVHDLKHELRDIERLRQESQDRLR